MPWIRANRAPTGSGGPEGALEAMEHVANWVRFADTKATILSAGVAAILAMSVSNAKVVVEHINCSPAGVAVSALAIASVLALLWTVFWLGRAIRPRRTAVTLEPNRFAWPAMSRLPLHDLQLHARTSLRDEDAWRQTYDLARAADEKFTACTRATSGFAVLVIATPACIITAIASSVG
jgi:hypothetical protein